MFLFQWLRCNPNPCHPLCPIKLIQNEWTNYLVKDSKTARQNMNFCRNKIYYRREILRRVEKLAKNGLQDRDSLIHLPNIHNQNTDFMIYDLRNPRFQSSCCCPTDLHKIQIKKGTKSLLKMQSFYFATKIYSLPSPMMDNQRASWKQPEIWQRAIKFTIRE